MRIVSLLPSATEIVCLLGLADDLRAVSHECDYPPQVRDKPVAVHSFLDPEQHDSGDINRLVAERLAQGQPVYALDPETLRAARPDLVLSQGLCDVCAVPAGDVGATLQELGMGDVRVLSLDPHSLDGLLEDIQRIAEAAGLPERGEAEARRLWDRIRWVEEQAAQADRRPRVLSLEWLDPPMTAGHWVPEMVGLAGGVEGLSEAGARSRPLDWGEVLDYAPETVFLMPCGFTPERTLRELRAVTERPGWERLPAVRQGRVYAVNGSAYFNRSGPRLVDGLEIMAELLHPELFPPVERPGDVAPVA